MDGAPCNWDRSETVETISLSLPGVVGVQGQMRVPLVAMLKRHFVKHQTADDFFDVLSWSMQCCITGELPSCRHDGSAWKKSDKSRAKLQSKGLGFRAFVVELRADWACLKETSRFPG
jgi:hypothetical protein